MAKVLSTKKARERFVAAVPLTFVGVYIMYGMYMLFYGNPATASRFDYVAVYLAMGTLIVLFVVFIFAILYYGHKLTSWWINNGK